MGLKGVPQREGVAARGAVDVDVGHGFVVFVADVFGVERYGGAFADAVFGHQIDGGAGAPGEGGYGVGFAYFGAVGRR